MTRAELFGLLAIASCTTAVAVRAAAAPAPPRARTPAPIERASFAATIAANERSWRDAAEIAWPADAWSQRDDFHSREADEIIRLADEHRVAREVILRAVDDDLHRRLARPDDPDPRGARAVPCKPRPIYD